MHASGEGSASETKGEENKDPKISMLFSTEEALVPHVDATSRFGLLDGGATHCLRFASPQEFAKASPVNVELAVSSTSDLRMNAVGILLSDDPKVQPIVPMGVAVRELGCIVDWTAEECKVGHPELGQLPITMNQECPLIPYMTTLDLIREVELKRGGARLCSSRVSEWQPSGEGWSFKGLSDENFLIKLRRLVKSMLPEVPESIADRLVPSKSYDPAASNLNRHCRRRLERGKAMIHVFSGKQAWSHPKGDPTLSVELENGQDFASDPLFCYLLGLARKGKVDKLIGGPPCRTWSALRDKAMGTSGDDGPSVVRARHGKGRFGLDSLSSADRQKVELDAVLLLRFVVLAEVAAAGLNDAEASEKHRALYLALEHPEDPLEYRPRASFNVEPATIWQWPEIKQFIQRHSLLEASFHQGVLGHPSVKPTLS